MRGTKQGSVSVKIGYIRVSTRDQSTARQEDAAEARCDELVVEKVSAVANARPEFDALLGRLGKGDSLVVLSLDRAFRSTLDALTVAGKLEERGVEFEIVQLGVETATPRGRLIFTMMSAPAEFERKQLLARTEEGRASARRRGVKFGRKPALTREQVAKARRDIEEGRESVATMARVLKVHRSTLYRALGSTQSVKE